MGRGMDWEAIVGGLGGQPFFLKRGFGAHFCLLFLPSVSLIMRKSLSMGRGGTRDPSL